MFTIVVCAMAGSSRIDHLSADEPGDGLTPAASSAGLVMARSAM